LIRLYSRALFLNALVELEKQGKADGWKKRCLAPAAESLKLRIITTPPCHNKGKKGKNNKISRMWFKGRLLILKQKTLKRIHIERCK